MKSGGSNTATILSDAAKKEPRLSIVDTAPASPQWVEVDSKLDDARERLTTLRRQQEELERQKSELEELRRKQDEYSRGKTEMIDNLTRGLSTLEREHIQAQRLSELCQTTTAAFRDYLEQLQTINDETWTASTVRAELTKALSTIENSRLEFNRARTKLDCLNPAAGQPLLPPSTTAAAQSIDWQEMKRYLRIGAAASAPLIIAGTIWLIALLAIRH
jgi:DNA repair exonuclease SbcCD ATPase subunit